MNSPVPQQGIDLGTADGVAELEEHVLCRLSGQIRYLRVVVTGGGILLSGHARTYHARQLAQDAVMEVTDLPILANQIEVC